MAQIVYNSYRDIIDNKGDPRVKDWFMMSSPIPTIAMSVCYAIFVTKIGPELMKNTKPFKLKNTLIIYNAIQVAISTWIFYEGSVSGWLNHYSYRCQPVDFSDDPLALRMARTCWWYYMSKFTEFFDTFFFVMRKKNNQISTLHVIHHCIMPVSTWIGVKFYPGGNGTFFGFLNTFVHIVMYTYYMLAAMGPQMQKYLWWKKYLTLLQIVQFILMFVHSLQTLVIECDYPKSYSYFVCAHALLFLVLFSNFYRQNYLRNKAREATQDAAKNGKHKSNGTTSVSPLQQTALNENVDIFDPVTWKYMSGDSDLRHRVDRS